MTNITVGITSKRINSTSNAMSSTVQLSCKLLDGCSEHNPIFRVSGLTKSTLYNYLSWGNYYYWIDDIRYLTNDIQELVCHLDPFATGKSNILNSSGFVEYSNATNWNEKIDDTRFSPEVSGGTNTYSLNMFDIKTSASGCIIMTFTQTASVDWMTPGATITTNCGIHTAILNWSNFRACLGDLTGFEVTIPDPSLVANIGEACMEIIQAFSRSIQSTGGGSILSNIMSCFWLPFDYDDLITYTSATQKTGLMMGGLFASSTVWYEIPNIHLYAKTTSQTISTLNSGTKNLFFLRHQRFTNVQIATPGGYCPIDGGILLKLINPIIHMKSVLNLSDGSWAVKLSSTNAFNDTLAGFSGNLGINLMGTIYAGPTTSSMIGDAVVGITKTALSMGVGSFMTARFNSPSGSLFTSNQNADFASYDDYQNLSNGINGNFPSYNSHSVANGNFGGTSCGLFINGDSTTDTASATKLYFNISYWRPKAIDDDTAGTYYTNFCNKYGYPCNKYLSLTNYSGYVKTVGISVQGGNGLNQSELATINSYMNNTGIYIE